MATTPQTIHQHNREMTDDLSPIGRQHEDMASSTPATRRWRRAIDRRRLKSFIQMCAPAWSSAQSIRQAISLQFVNKKVGIDLRPRTDGACHNGRLIARCRCAPSAKPLCERRRRARGSPEFVRVCVAVGPSVRQSRHCALSPGERADGGAVFARALTRLEVSASSVRVQERPDAWTTVAGNVAALICSRSSRDAARRDGALARLASGFADVSRELSGGMKMRVQSSRALVHESCLDGEAIRGAR